MQSQLEIAPLSLASFAFSPRTVDFLKVVALGGAKHSVAAGLSNGSLLDVFDIDHHRFNQLFELTRSGN